MKIQHVIGGSWIQAAICLYGFSALQDARKSRPRLITTIACSLILWTGCAVGPNYHAPKTALPGGWSETANMGETNGPAQLVAWWKNFHDLELDSLIERAAGSNFNLKAAQARVRAAR